MAYVSLNVLRLVGSCGVLLSYWRLQSSALNIVLTTQALLLIGGFWFKVFGPKPAEDKQHTVRNESYNLALC